MVKRFMPWLVAIAALVGSAAHAQPLPARNLEVAWRWAEQSERSGSEAAVRSGGLVVGTSGHADARGTVTLRSGSRQEADEGEHRLVVLNGGRAQVRLSKLVPLQWVEAASGPGGTAGILRQGWTEAGRGFEVRPRWPGGHAPVAVDIVMQSAEAPANPQEPPARDSLATTVQVPLDVWTTVAESGEEGETRSSGVLSSRDAERHVRRLLQLRVSVR